MSMLSRAGDLVYAFRFLKLLTTPFPKTKAFKLGIVDKDGKVLKKGKELATSEEKAAYTVFHRLVFNIKRLLAKAPGGKTALATYATALFLIKEHTGMHEDTIVQQIEKYTGEKIGLNLDENTWHMDYEDRLMPGKYMLTKDIYHPKTGEQVANIGERVVVNDLLSSAGNFLNLNIYKVQHPKTGQDLYISNRDIIR